MQNNQFVENSVGNSSLSSSDVVSAAIKNFLFMVKNKSIPIDQARVHTNFEGKFMIGGCLVDFVNDVMFDKTKNTKYKFSLRLAALVFKKDPNFNVVTDND